MTEYGYYQDKDELTPQISLDSTNTPPQVHLFL